MDIKLISQEDFAAFEEVRTSGVVNMLDPQVCELAGFDREIHTGILKHYGELCRKWPAIRNLEEKS